MENAENFVLDWTSEQVANWLTQKGHGKYAPLLCDQHRLDGRGLFLLHEEDLKSPPISIEILGDIKRIIYDIESFKKEIHNDIRDRGYDPRSLVKITRSHSAMVESTSSYVSREVVVIPRGNFKVQDNILKPELVKMVVAAVYLFVVSWILAFVMVIVHDRVPDMKKYPPLPDIFLDNIPLVPWAFKLSEICGTLLMFIWISVCIFHKHRTILLRRFFALLGTAYLLRSVTVVITSLSVPGEHIECSPRTYSDQSIRQKLEEAFIIWKGAGLSIQGINTCGDYLFSGHTTAVTFLNFFITEYTPNTQIFYVLHLLAWVVNILAIGCILASHEHYSIDVFIAFYITSRLFLYYHSLANNQALYQKDSHRVRIWFPLFGYLESSMTRRVPNEYHTLGEIFVYVMKKIKQLMIIVRNMIIPM
ncbi:sphingomyelin synthase-related protein 1-like [Diaphorina citri]|uniref:Sphingomyelin synthase-related protein 1-like n=1 Tax=Diaphorina citri TaxID=121845 RepID=A0A1S3DV10_DIACI|nr:sphingomyelin synthase-related protein 1-like [Diaphorina citri]